MKKDFFLRTLLVTLITLFGFFTDMHAQTGGEPGDEGNFETTDFIDMLQYQVDVQNGYAVVFKCKQNAKKVDIPASIEYNGVNLPVKEIAREAFKECSALRSVTIPETVTRINELAFYYCISIEDLTIPNSVEYIGESAFAYAGLETVTIGTGISAISPFTFFECESLDNVVIPENVKNIGDYAFQLCKALTSITIPNSVETIGDGVFAYCPVVVNLSNDNPYFVYEDGALYDRSKTKIYAYNTAKTGHYDIADTVEEILPWAFCSTKLTTVGIPESVNKIGLNAFCLSNTLTSVSIPEGVTTIPGYCFQNCKVLKEIKLPQSLTILERYALSMCSALENLTLPDNLSFIGEGQFWGDPIKKIVLPKTLETMERYIFLDCNDLTSVTSLMEEPIPAEEVFFTADIATLYVPEGTKSLYLAAAGWQDFSNIVEMDAGVKDIEDDNIIRVVNGTIECPVPFDVYSIDGIRVNAKDALPSGLYIVRTAGKTLKIAI